jgi:hypothetical protein
MEAAMVKRKAAKGRTDRRRTAARALAWVMVGVMVLALMVSFWPRQ